MEDFAALTTSEQVKEKTVAFLAKTKEQNSKTQSNNPPVANLKIQNDAANNIPPRPDRHCLLS